MLHVFDRVDGDAAHADVAEDARIVRVVAAVRRQVERHAETLLARFDVVTVEFVAFFDRAEASVLADCPWFVSVHCWVGSARVWIFAGQLVGDLVLFEIVGEVNRLNFDTLGCFEG